MKHQWIIDIPNPSHLDAEWIEIATFDSHEAAIAFAREHYGADAKGRINLVSEVEGMDDDV